VDATTAQRLRTRAAVVAVAALGAADAPGVAHAGALMPDGERIDAVVRAGRTVPDPATGGSSSPVFEPTAEPSGLPAAEAIVAAAGAAVVGIAAAALAGRRRLRPVSSRV
jgi:hypothetical protein